MQPAQLDGAVLSLLGDAQALGGTHLLVPGHPVQRVTVITGMIRRQNGRRVFRRFKDGRQLDDALGDVAGQLGISLPNGEILSRGDLGFCNDRKRESCAPDDVMRGNPELTESCPQSRRNFYAFRNIGAYSCTPPLSSRIRSNRIGDLRHGCTAIIVPVLIALKPAKSDRSSTSPSLGYLAKNGL